MTRKDLDRLFTAKVTELLVQGYQINTLTMSGSQGEIAHVDLANGSEILRVLMERVCDYRATYGDSVRISVGRCTDIVKGSWHDNIWNNRLETIFEIKFTHITDNYYTTPEAAEPMAEKRLARWRAKDTARRTLGDAYKSVALRWVQKQPRMKSCRLDEIESVTRVSKTAWGKTLPDLDCYEIKARGKVFQLRARREA